MELLNSAGEWDLMKDFMEKVAEVIQEDEKVFISWSGTGMPGTQRKKQGDAHGVGMWNSLKSVKTCRAQNT